MNTAALWVLGLVATSIDGLVWGVAACAAHRRLRGPGRGWLGPALVAGSLFVVWDQWVFAEFVHWAGMPRGHAEPIRLLEVGTELVATLAGFRGGRTLLDAIVRREGEVPRRGSSSPPTAPPCGGM
jgi:hypothetical protein